MRRAHRRSGAGLVQQTVQIVASLRSHDLTLFVGQLQWELRLIIERKLRLHEFNDGRTDILSQLFCQ